MVLLHHSVLLKIRITSKKYFPTVTSSVFSQLLSLNERCKKDINNESYWLLKFLLLLERLLSILRDFVFIHKYVKNTI